MMLGGSVQSPDAGSRFLLLNGDVVREGATIAPGLTLESIRPGEAVFNLRGTRWRMAL
jgi:general secretion pathway protein B